MQMKSVALTGQLVFATVPIKVWQWKAELTLISLSLFWKIDFAKL